MSDFHPVGGNLPPRRDSLVEAKAAAPVASFSDSIIVPQARDRMLEIFERERTPAEVKGDLAAALNGDLEMQNKLFQAMVDTWPRLQKALREVKTAVRNAPWEVVPWAERGGEPDEKSQKLAKEVDAAIWSMKPDMPRNLKGFEGMIEALAEGYFFGHQVLEPRWLRSSDGVRPTCVKVLPPRFYGYPNYEDGEDRLMLNRKGGWGGYDYEDFPENRFLVGVSTAHPGHPAVAAPLRALAGYWLSAVYGLKWFLQFCQLYGIPFRWATYGDDANRSKVVTMMQNIGAQGWAAFPSGTEMNFLDSSKAGSSLPQYELLKLADEQCDIFILGQTLTTSQGDQGSQALGKVHEGVRSEMLSGICDFVGEVLTHQLVPAYVAWNYGPAGRDDMPGIWAKFEQPKDSQAMATRDQTLGLLDGKLPVEREWFYERHDIPMPADNAVLLVEKKEPTENPPPVPPGNRLPMQDDEEDQEPPDEEVEAALAVLRGMPDAELKAGLLKLEASAADYLRAALHVVETNAPINDREGKFDQAELERLDAADIRRVLSMNGVDSPDLSRLMKRMESVLDSGSFIDDQAMADILAAAWVSGAKGPNSD